jgi:hypothetical protein
VKVSYVEGVANHNGLESCVNVCKDGGKALTEGRAGRVLSREMRALPRKRQVLRDADAVGAGGRQHRVHRHRKVRQDPARSQTLCMYRSSLLGNREIPRAPRLERAAGRIGKSNDIRR